MMKPFWKWLLAAWMGATIGATFLFVPPEARGFEHPRAYRILFYHVPMAWVATLAFFVAMGYAIQYLRTRQPAADDQSAAAAELGLLFCTLATVTGAIWSRLEWGQYWHWDPRQTSMAVLLLIYGAYMGLRGAMADEEQRARLAAVYAVLAAATVPFLVFVIPRVFESLHPDPVINTQGHLKMDVRMMITLLMALAGFTGVYLWLHRLRVRLAQWERRGRERWLE